MREIFVKEYFAHKKFICIYLLFCVLITAFFCPISGDFFQGTAYAQELLSGEDTLLELAGAFTGTSLMTLAGNYSQIVGVSCEPFTALFFIGLIENINRWCGSPLEIASTPVGNPIVLILVGIFLVASKIMRSNEATQVFGIVTLGQLEKFLGLVFILVLGAINVAGISTFAGTAVVKAAPILSQTTQGTNTLSVIFSTFIAILMGILSLIVFYIIKTVALGLEVLQMTFSFIPGSALFFETLKSFMVIFLVTVNVLCPPLGIALNIVIVLISCFLFRSCYAAVQYLKKIYVRPLLKSFRGFDENIPICAKKFPSKIRKYFETMQEGEIEMAIPLYALKKKKEEYKVRRYDKWWLVNVSGINYLCRKKFWGKRIKMIPFNTKEENPIYIHKGIRFIEVFDYSNKKPTGLFKQPKKGYHFVLSKEYLYRLEDIYSLTGYLNHNEIKAKEKLDKKEQRAAKRKEKWERITQKQENAIAEGKGIYGLFRKDKNKIS